MRPQGVKTQGLLDWRTTLEEWIDQGEFELALARMAEWDEQEAEWWTHFGDLLDRIPTELLERFPRLVLRSALPALWAGREAEAFAIQRRAEELAPPELALDAQISRANLYMTSRQYYAAERIYRKVAESSTEPRHRLQSLNGLALTALAEHFDTESASNLLDTLARESLEAGHAGHYLVALINRCWHIEIPLGQFSEARATAQRILEMRGDPKHSPFYRMCGKFDLGMLEYHLGSPATVETLSSSHDLAGRLGVRSIEIASAALLADHCAARGRTEEAERWIAVCDQCDGHDELGEVALHLARARLGAASESHAAMRRHLAHAKAAAHAPDLEAFAAVEEAWVLLAAEDRFGASDAARKATDSCESKGMSYLAVRARLAECASSPGTRRSELERMLRTAEERGYDSLFVAREPEAATPVLVRAVETRTCGDYARALLEQIGITTVRIRTFGTLRVAIDRQEVPESAWARPKARALFAYLLIRERRAVPCEEVEAALWPDQTSEEARNSLRVAASYIRRALRSNGGQPAEGPAIVLEAGSIRLDLGRCRWRDDEEFARSASNIECPIEDLGEEDLNEFLHTLELAREDFLSEYREEPWSGPMRSKLAGIRRGIRLRAGELALRLGRLHDARRLAEELLEETPTHEEGAVLAIEALVRSGQKTEARLLAERFCADWRACGLGTPPPAIASRCRSRTQH